MPLLPNLLPLLLGVLLFAKLPYSVHCVSPIPVAIAPLATTCAIYQLAYEFSHHIQPTISESLSAAIWDALRLDECPSVLPRRAGSSPPVQTQSADLPADAIYVDPLGDDRSAGGSLEPLRTIAEAQRRARLAKRPSTILLREGRHYLSQTLQLTPLDSGLTVQAFPNERAVITGGVVLQVEWEPYRVEHGQNVWLARGVHAPANMTGLRIGSQRAIRARWPNGDPEYQLYPDGWESAGNWGAPRRFPAAATVVVESPNRSTEMLCNGDFSDYCNYRSGVGGACAGYGFSPPAGYWCQPSPPRGSQYTTGFPASLEFEADHFGGRNWSSWRANETVVNAFRDGHWFSYTFLVDSYDAQSRTLGWTVGGFQGGEGSHTAAEWNVENILEELDYPNEFYLDTSADTLYYFFNGTGPPPTDAIFEGVALEELISITGAGSARGEEGAPHAEDITLRGLELTGAAMTTLAPHGLPSDGGGDWAVARRAAVHATGVERLAVEDCVFERLDGNALMLSGYSRNATVKHNEFHLIGESAIVSWGYTADFPDTERDVPLPPKTGPDARDGNHPQGTLVEGNVIHEIGHFQKQVSCYFQAQSQGATLRRNICFNGPRAGINLNDGMGGRNLLEENLIFNMVRETADHGAFNSWDRQPFFVQGADEGEGSFVPEYNELRRNFMVNDYNPQESVDNDDGSSYYETHHNFLVLSQGGLKSDFGGHNNLHHAKCFRNFRQDNVYYTSTQCMGVSAQTPGHADGFWSNVCIINADSPTYASFSPDPAQLPTMHDNRVFTRDGMALEAGASIAEWQAMGHDLGTTVTTIPSDDTIVNFGREVLGMVVPLERVH